MTIIVIVFFFTVNFSNIVNILLSSYFFTNSLYFNKNKNVQFIKEIVFKNYYFLVDNYQLKIYTNNLLLLSQLLFYSIIKLLFKFHYYYFTINI